MRGTRCRPKAHMSTPTLHTPRRHKLLKNEKSNKNEKSTRSESDSHKFEACKRVMDNVHELNSVGSPESPPDEPSPDPEFVPSPSGDDELKEGEERVPTPELDWRTIQRLRLQRDASRQVLDELREMEQEATNIKHKIAKRARLYEEHEDPKSARDTEARHRRPMSNTRIPEERQLAYIQMKRAIDGVIKRYDCTDRQRVALLYDAIDKIKGK